MNGMIDRKDKGFFLFPKRLVVQNGRLGLWSTASPAVKNISMGIMHYMDSRSLVAFPSSGKLAKCCGITKRSLARARQKLGEMDIVFSEGFTDRGHASFIYQSPACKGETHNMAMFDHAMFSDGTWASMPQSAKSLYVAMKGVSYTDDCEDDDGKFDKEIAKGREFDFCDAPDTKLAELAGLDRKSFRVGIKWLMDNRLVEDCDPSECDDEGTPRKLPIPKSAWAFMQVKPKTDINYTLGDQGVK